MTRIFNCHDLGGWTPTRCWLGPNAGDWCDCPQTTIEPESDTAAHADSDDRAIIAAEDRNRKLDGARRWFDHCSASMRERPTPDNLERLRIAGSSLIAEYITTLEHRAKETAQ